MNCATLADRLTDFLEGELTPAEESAAIAHLSTCTFCEGVLADTRKVVQLAHQHGRAELTAQDRERLLASLLGEVSE